ncbi:MAG TPA: SIS domain-containing protein [Woeseiaceae bacterium]|nr:SIS domain-containing protein [Woeseiaceae bacterium]
MLNRIQQQAGRLSRAERRVAEWVLAHPRQAADATLAEVARECGASEPTVIRFCRRVGLTGFRELTIRLTEALSRPDRYVHRDVNPDDATADAVTKVLDAAISSLLDMRAQLSSIPIDAAAAVLLDARQITFIGLGASGHVAADARHKFFRLGTPCNAHTDTPSILQAAAVAGPGDVLVIVSHLGGWPELERAAAAARDNGATVIALTNPASRLARIANLVFGWDPHEDTSVYTPMSSRLAQLALLDALYVAFALALGDVAADKLRRSKEALRQH